MDEPSTNPTASPAPPEASTPTLPEGRLIGRTAFLDAVRQAVAASASQGWSRILLSDPDFADWPLGEREVIEGLNAWAHRGRTMRLMAREFATLRQMHPRFVQWRTTWGHLIEVHAVPEAGTHELPSVIWTPNWTLERLDPVRSVVVASRSAERRVALQESLEGWWHRGRPSFSASTLGL